MKKFIKNAGLLLIIVTAASCSESKKSGCYTFTYENNSIENKIEAKETEHKLYQKINVDSAE